MKDKFFADGNDRGLARIPFVHAVFMHLFQTTKGLHVKADAARVVAMLDELFDQIGVYLRGWWTFYGRWPLLRLFVKSDSPTVFFGLRRC